MTTDLKAEALEKAEKIFNSIEDHGKGYYGRLWTAIAAALIRERALEAEQLGEYSHFDHNKRAAQARAAVLRRIAGEIEGGE